jgi:glycerol-1-phosphate dehydrogenase [NAD(P)+]
MTDVTSLLDWPVLRARLAGDPGLGEVGMGRVGMSVVDLGVGALDRLPATVEHWAAGRSGDIVLLRDPVAKRRGTDDLHALVNDALGGVREVTLTGPHGLVHADEATTATAVAGTAGAAVLVTVGSGTLADLGKVAAAENGLPHVIVQTATSVNGFADDQSVLLRSGVKRTVPSRWPDALIVDADVLAAAPAALNRAGVGDLLSMFTAPADWLLASLVGFPVGYRPAVVDLVRPHGERLLSLIPRLATADRDALSVLAELLTLSGVSMGVAGNTAPSSGYEHLISHLLDMDTGARGRPAGSHGTQVGVGSLVAAATWARVRRCLASGEIPAPRVLEPDDARRRVDEAFGPLDPSGRTAAECWTAYSAKLRDLNRLLPGLRRLLADWTPVQAQLDPLLLGPDRLVEALRGLDAPTRFADLDPAPDRAVAPWAVANAHLMRNRFTVADLADLLGLGGAAGAGAVLDDLAAWGAGR